MPVHSSWQENLLVLQIGLAVNLQLFLVGAWMVRADLTSEFLLQVGRSVLWATFSFLISGQVARAAI